MGELEAAPARFVVDSDFDMLSKAEPRIGGDQYSTVQRGCISESPHSWHRLKLEIRGVCATRAVGVSGSVRHMLRMSVADFNPAARLSS